MLLFQETTIWEVGQVRWPNYYKGIFGFEVHMYSIMLLKASTLLVLFSPHCRSMETTSQYEHVTTCTTEWMGFYKCQWVTGWGLSGVWIERGVWGLRGIGGG